MSLTVRFTFFNSCERNDLDFVRKQYEMIKFSDAVLQQACFYASSRGAIDVVSYLITLGVSPTSSKADPDLQHGRNCFFVAVAAQQRKLVRYFIQDLKIDPNVPGTLEGRTAMHAAAFGNDILMMEYLFAKGAKLDSTMKDGSTPFHDACEGGAILAINWLLKHGIDPTIRKNVTKETSLYMAVGDVKTVEFLLKDSRILPQINIPNLIGDTPLHSAVCTFNEASIVKLLEFGANPNAKNSNFETPLHFAVKRHSQKVIELLIQAGGNLMLKSKKERKNAFAMATTWKFYLLDMWNRLKCLKIAFRICRIFMSNSKAFNNPYFGQVITGIIRELTAPHLTIQQFQLFIKFATDKSTLTKSFFIPKHMSQFLVLPEKKTKVVYVH